MQYLFLAGHERFRSITSSYYRSAHGVIITFDITKKQTFLSLQKWLTEIRNYTANNVVCALIGNKCDLEDREVTVEEAEQVVSLVPEILFYLETSAKENTNVERAFTQIAEELMVRSNTHHHAMPYANF
jgi:Ras-related protein Rab-43